MSKWQFVSACSPGIDKMPSGKFPNIFIDTRKRSTVTWISLDADRAQHSATKPSLFSLSLLTFLIYWSLKMSSQMFDAQAFMQATFEGANDTISIPVPAGEHPAVAEKVDLVAWQGKADPTKGGLKLNILWEIASDDVREITGRSKNVVRQDIMLDLTPDGRLDMGKGMNVRLGRLREAVGLNRPGEPFSFAMIQGQFATVSVKHELYEGAIQAKVDGVLAAN